MAEAGGERDDKPHMGGGEFVKRSFVAVVLPADGERVLFVALQERAPPSRP